MGKRKRNTIVKCERSSGYRKEFFDNNQKRRYHCAYCGRRLKKEDVEVDHLVPVIKAKNSWAVRLCLWLRGIKDVNDPDNLVAACQKCNRKKSSKMGRWVIRGMIGRYKIIWILRNILLILLAVFALYIVLETGINDGVFNKMREALRILFM